MSEALTYLAKTKLTILTLGVNPEHNTMHVFEHSRNFVPSFDSHQQSCYTSFAMFWQPILRMVWSHESRATPQSLCIIECLQNALSFIPFFGKKLLGEHSMCWPIWQQDKVQYSSLGLKPADSNCFETTESGHVSFTFHQSVGFCQHEAGSIKCFLSTTLTWVVMVYGDATNKAVIITSGYMRC